MRRYGEGLRALDLSFGFAVACVIDYRTWTGGEREIERKTFEDIVGGAQDGRINYDGLSHSSHRHIESL